MGYYDNISKGYLLLHSDEQVRKARIIVDELKPAKSALLLDVGCGPAPYFSMIPCIKVGIDPSMGLLRLAKGGLFIRAAAESLPFQDRCFDYVISVTAVHNFSSMEKGIREIHRVAKGEVAFSILKASKKLPQIDRLIRRFFTVRQVLSDDKDDIYFCRVRKNSGY